MKTLLCSVVALTLAVGLASAQAITFTGDVAADFAPSQYNADPGGNADVGLPAVLAGAQSGWEILGVALSYDDVNDVLYVGIDTLGIAGDADGDGNPGMASPALDANGGDDLPNFGGTESFTFGLDLDADGLLDIVAGVPAGNDLSGWTVSLYNNFTFFPGQNTFTDPYNRFGAPLPANTGPPPVSPSAAFPDLEFTIPNFSALLEMFGMPGQTMFGLHVFMGSQQDDGVGEDYLPAIETLDLPLLPCFPIPANLEITDITANMMTGGDTVTTQLGVPNGYGCCFLYSQFENTMPFQVLEVPGQPFVNVGITAIPGTINVIDLGIPPGNGNAVECKVSMWELPPLPPGTKIYAQAYLYPVSWLPPHLTSNVVCYEAGAQVQP